MKHKPLQCVGCPAYEWGIGFVPPTSSSDPTEYLIIGQGPGEQEAKFREPFYHQAPSGARLRSWLAKARWPESKTVIGNIVQCWLPKTKVNGKGRGNRAPLHCEMVSCWHRHVKEWVEGTPGRIVAVGAPAAQFLLGLGGKATEKYMGTCQLVELPDPLPQEGISEEAT